MRHLLLIKNGPSRTGVSPALLNYLAPIGFAACNHFLRARMLGARFLQIECVKRLIDNNGIGPISPCPHHSGRDIARPRPHRDAGDGNFGLRHPIIFAPESRNYESGFYCRRRKYRTLIYLTPQIPDQKFRPVLCFAKWTGEWPVQRGNQLPAGEFRTNRGERCAASRAFSGSSPTANLVSNIKMQGMS